MLDDLMRHLEIAEKGYAALMAENERLRGEISYLTDAVIPALREENERLSLGLVQITDETVTDMVEIRNIARELLGWEARDYQQKADDPSCSVVGCRFHTEPLMWCGKPLPLYKQHIGLVTVLLCPACKQQAQHSDGDGEKGDEK